MANVKSLRIVLLLFACCYSTSGSSFNESLAQLSRFFVVPTTLTSTVLQTKIVTSFTPSTALCYKTVAGITECRRKRNDVEQPLIVNVNEVQPTEPLLVVPTAEPKALFSVRQPQLASPSVSSSEIVSSIPMPVTDGVAEVRFNNLESACRARVANPQFGNLAAVALEAFRITVAYSTTVTSTVSETLTSPMIVTIKTVTFDGCNPSNYVTITPCK